jgi:hypothetical protein
MFFIVYYLLTMHYSEGSGRTKGDEGRAQDADMSRAPGTFFYFFIIKTIMILMLF